LPGGVKKRLSFGRKADKKIERIPTFGGGKDPVKRLFIQMMGL
jgi:hypothetical protein